MRPCAQNVLHLMSAHPEDDPPRQAPAEAAGTTGTGSRDEQGAREEEEAVGVLEARRADAADALRQRSTVAVQQVRCAAGRKLVRDGCRQRWPVSSVLLGRQPPPARVWPLLQPCSAAANSTVRSY